MWRSLQKQDRGTKQREQSTAIQGAKISHDGIQHAKMHSKVRNSKSKILHTSIQGAKISHHAKHSPGTRVAFRTAQTNFRIVRIKVRKFHTPLFKVRNSFQGAKISVQGASISHTTIQGAKFIPTCEFECENFATVGYNFEALLGAQIIHMICRFEAWEVRNPVLQTVHDLDLKRRSYGCLKTTMQS